MEQAPALGQTWALLIDPAAARDAIERVSKLHLQRRICRPLDRKRKQTTNAELARFDAAVEAEPVDEEDTGEIAPETLPAAPLA